MNISCSAKANACPILLSSACVFYEGENLIYTGINTNDTVETALEKIDARFANLIFTVNVIAPLQKTGTINTIISIPKATTLVDGYLASTDWTIFNNKQNAITLSTTGSSGVATFNGTSGALNIPNYTLSGLGGNLQAVTDIGSTTTNVITASGFTLTAQPLGVSTYSIGQTMATNDSWRIYGFANTIDNGDLIFELEDNAALINGQRFRFRYGNISSGTPKDILLMNYDGATIDGSLQVNNLAGVGTRMVVSDANGALSTQSITSGTVTSVGLSMPVAFSVANSPITSSGTLAVTAIGTAAQYIRGDGQLATLPSGASGGSAVNYYLNGSVAASVATYFQMSKTPVIGAGTDFSKAGNGLISQFLTDVADPNRLEIPAGNWNFEMYMSASSSGGTPAFYVELLKYNGTTFTSIASSSAIPEAITGGTLIDLYLTSLAIPQTTLLSTDRLAIRVYIVNSTAGRTITLHTEDSHLCEIITNFAGGVSALNGLTANTQYFATGTSGTDFAISSLTDTHTFNLPTASATNRGALSSTDWTTFNNKQATLTLTTTGTSGAATLIGATLNIPQYSGGGGMAIGGAITSATAGSVLFAGTSGVLQQDNANFFWDDANNRLGIGTATPTKALEVTSDILINSLTIGTGGSTTTIPNTVFGNGALNATTTGVGQNLAFGYQSMKSLTTGAVNTAVGYRTSTALTTGSNNVSIGADSMKTATTASFNVAIGTLTLQNLTTTSNNVAIGYSSSSSMTSATNNTGIGTSTLAAVTTGNSNTAIGSEAMDGLTTGTQNVAIGYACIGSGSFNGSNNVGIGVAAGGSLTSGTDNFIAGSNAMVFQTTGSSNIVIGTDAGRYIVAGTNNTISNTSIFIGQDTRPLAISQSNQIIIGNSGRGLGSNTTVIGNSSTTDAAIYGRLLVNYSAPVIGTYALDVNGTARVSGSTTFGTLGTGTGMFWDNTNNRLGIGVSSPTEKLDVYGAVKAYALNINGIGTITSYTTIGTTAFTDSASSIIIGYVGGTASRLSIASNTNYQDAQFINTTIASGNINSWAFGQRRDTYFGNSLGSFQIVGGYIDNTGAGSMVGGGYRVPMICNPNGDVIIAGASTNAINGNVSVGSTTIPASAKLSVTSTTQGFLPPRMTTTQKNAIVSPVAGLQVYDGTLNLPSFYNGTVWVELPISGTYTPTVAVISGGATSVTSNVARYIRVGNVVTVYGVFFYQPSGSGAVETNNEFTITLPITRTVTTNFASGTVSFSTVIGVGEQSQGYLYGTAATTISLYAQNWFSGSGANAFYTFSYEIN